MHEDKAHDVRQGAPETATEVATPTPVRAGPGSALGGLSRSTPSMRVPPARHGPGAPGGVTGALRRTAATAGTGLVVRRGGKGGGTAVKETPEQAAEKKKPQAGTKYSLEEARTALKAADHSVKGMPFRKQIAEAWGTYIITTFGTLKPGGVRDTYKSSFDQADPDEFSVSQEIIGVPEMVIHAHMDKTGAAKGGNAVHWKWADGEKVAESYELTSGQVSKLLDQKVAKSHWDTTGKAAWQAKIALPVGGGGGAAVVPPVVAPVVPPVVPPVVAPVVPSAASGGPGKAAPAKPAWGGTLPTSVSGAVPKKI